MTDGVEEFDGCLEFVRQRRGYRRWPDELKARIVAESFQPGARVADVARRNGLEPHHLSAWRRQARDGILALPAEVLEGIEDLSGPGFVPLSIDLCALSEAPVSATPEAMIIEVGDVRLRLPGDAGVDRIAALVRALARSS